MVKLKVLSKFRDAETGELRRPGNIFEASEKRAKVLLAAGVVEIVKEEPRPTNQKTTEKKKSEKK